MIYNIKPLTAAQITKATGGELVWGNRESTISGISCDSRTISDTTLYIPIKGERFDGHSFLNDVGKSGIGGCIFSDDADFEAPFAVRVTDTSKALLDIAQFYRSLFSLPVVGLTGSVGKTTTKELIASVLSEHFNTLATKGNFNNNIGVPYTLFGLNDSHEAAVIEMGMSNFGEIKVLSECAKPDIAVITNIGTSHIEFLGSRDGILQAKTEIFCGMSENGYIVLNGDDDKLITLKGNIPFETVFVGIENNACDYVAYDIESSENGCDFTVGQNRYHINVPGTHNIYNALCAIAVGEKLGMEYDEISHGLQNYHPDGIRQNIMTVNGFKLINDCYNSSPQSVSAALGMLAAVEAKRKIAVLGDIAELGDYSESLHREVGRAVRASDADVLVTVGTDSRFIAHEADNKETYSFADSDEAAEFMKTFVTQNDAVLIKGSRCMKMEKISETLCECLARTTN